MKMGLQDQVDQMQHRQGYRNLWHTDLMGTMVADPAYCCFACCCPLCASFTLRKRTLYNDMTRYRCCGGYMPCSGKFGERQCPTLCLGTEVCCCFASSVASTRWIIQDEFNIQTTKCDNCIIGFMLCLNQLACICSLIACLSGGDELTEIANVLSCIADMVYCSVCACMQTQHKIELNKRDGKFVPQPVMAVPPAQRMSRIDQPVSPNAGDGYQPPPGVAAYHPPPPGVAAYHSPPPPGYGQPYPLPYQHIMPSVGHGVYGPPPPDAYPPESPAAGYPPHSVYSPSPIGFYPPGPPPPQHSEKSSASAGVYPPGPPTAPPSESPSVAYPPAPPSAPPAESAPVACPPGPPPPASIGHDYPAPPFPTRNYPDLDPPK